MVKASVTLLSIAHLLSRSFKACNYISNPSVRLCCRLPGAGSSSKEIHSVIHPKTVNLLESKDQFCWSSLTCHLRRQRNPSATREQRVEGVRAPSRLNTASLKLNGLSIMGGSCHGRCAWIPHLKVLQRIIDTENNSGSK